ncbi:MAG: sigma-70 family RNA polymerase sigma factor [Gammaproteobacteria bacterium]|nr:sigma-70 family RNA polymerase sigma factor [Gammaproteobacteria bacterium]
MKLDRENLQKLYRYAYTLTANEDDAYDLLQSAIEISLRKLADGTENSAAYIRMIMKNRYIDEYRHQQSFPHENIGDNSPVSLDESTLEDIVIAGHDLALLWKTLAPLDREVLFFWAVEGFSMQEIAEKLEISRGTLLSRVHRLRRRLQAEAGAGQRGIA